MNAPAFRDRVSNTLATRDSRPSPATSGVLVTGSANRIGRAIALDLARAGWPVAVHFHRSEASAAALQAEIEQEGGRVALVQADLASHREVATLIDRASSDLGPIGVLINNASLFEYDDVETVDRASWSRNMDVNLRAPVLLSRKFSEALPAHLRGVIINMLDSRVINPTSRYLTYTLSKSGLTTLTDTLAQAMAPRIRVVGIAPGPTLPEADQTLDEFRARCEQLPLRQPASLEDICKAVRFFIEVESVTGQVLALDGGSHMT